MTDIFLANGQSQRGWFTAMRQTEKELYKRPAGNVPHVGEDGKTYYVPEDMAYKDWAGQHGAGVPTASKPVKEPHDTYIGGVVNTGKSAIMETKQSHPFKVNIQLFAEKDIKNQSSISLNHAIRQYKKRIDENNEKIDHSEVHIPNWISMMAEQRPDLIKHWKKEIRNFNQSIE